jgi:hypothetical protein
MYMKKGVFGMVLLVSSLLIACSKDDDELSGGTELNDGLALGVNYGIAAAYPDDVGLGQHPEVLAFEDFESGEVTIETEEDRYKKFSKVVSTSPLQGKYCGEHSWTDGYEGPTCRYPLPERAHEGERPAYFVRMYIKHSKSFHPYYNTSALASGDYRSVGVKGFGIANESVAPSSEIPDGTNWYNAQVQFVGWGPSVKPQANDKFLWVGHLYSYNAYPNDATALVGEKLKVNGTSDGQPAHRFSAYAEPFTYLSFDRWYCYEMGLYLNTPGEHDGEARFWIDGVLQSRTVNMRYRDIEELLPMYVHLNMHRTTAGFSHTMKRYVDNIVIARKYIGPMK